VQARFCVVPAAEAALRSGAAPILLGALPFDVNAPAALTVPGTVRRTGALPDWPTGPLPPARIAATVPTPEDVS
jgi:isochorismate synthase